MGFLRFFFSEKGFLREVFRVLGGWLRGFEVRGPFKWKRVSE